jgi:type I restriction enzyme S subunit
MSRIDELIERLCPEGVEFKALGEVCTVGVGQRPNPESSGGDFWWWNGGIEPSGKVGESNTDGDTITIPSRGSVGFVRYQKKPFWCGPLCYKIRSKREDLLTGFLFYYLKRIQESLIALQQTGSIPALNKKELVLVRVPVPPLEVQREIVRVLDQFTELEAELEARRRQYEYYRKSVVGKARFASNEWVRLSVLASVSTGSRPEEVVDAGVVPYINAGTEPSGFTSAPNAQGGVITIPSRGQGAAGHVGYQEGDFWCGPLCYRVDSKSSDFMNRFLYFFLREIQEEIVGLRKTGSIPAVNKSDLGGILVPVVGTAEQRRIVAQLDQFDALVNDLSVGLPAELAARRKQYEYYRDKLLTFTEATP